LILRKSIKIVATKCQFLRPKCTNVDFGWSSAPDPARGAYSALPDPLAVFKGPTSKGREGKGRGRERKGRGGEGKGREREREGEGLQMPKNAESWLRHCAKQMSLHVTFDSQR